MKKLVGGLLLLGVFAFSNAQTITFDKTTIDYGTVKANSDGNKVFTFTNTGDKPLILSNVQPGCGCTASEYTKEPILPGKKGEIKVHYNTATVAPFKKTIDVFSNDPANGRIVLYIQGTVVNADTNIAAPATPVKEVAAPVVSTNTKATPKVKKVSKAKKS
jgi:hypothetical protein